MPSRTATKARRETTIGGDETEAGGSFAAEYGFRRYRFVFDEAFVARMLAGVAAVILTVPVLVRLLSPSSRLLLG